MLNFITKSAMPDILSEGSTNPPVHGTGIPSRYYILSNNHVLANSNDAAVGDPILQPGAFDGGTTPTDIIAMILPVFSNVLFKSKVTSVIAPAVNGSIYYLLSAASYFTITTWFLV